MAKRTRELFQEREHIADEHENKDAGNNADRQRWRAEPERLGERFDRPGDQQRQFLPM